MRIDRTVGGQSVLSSTVLRYAPVPEFVGREVWRLLGEIERNAGGDEVVWDSLTVEVRRDPQMDGLKTRATVAVQPKPKSPWEVLAEVELAIHEERKRREG